MKKILVSVIFLLTSLVAFTTVSEAATVSPPTQEIRGSTARADWDFSWGIAGTHSVSFNPGDGTGSRVWDSNNTVGYSSIFYSYYSQNSWVTYNASFRATRLSDNTSSVAYATVQKRLP